MGLVYNSKVNHHVVYVCIYYTYRSYIYMFYYMHGINQTIKLKSMYINVVTHYVTILAMPASS